MSTFNECLDVYANVYRLMGKYAGKIPVPESLGGLDPESGPWAFLHLVDHVLESYTTKP